MRFTSDINGVITCEHSSGCGRCRVKEHSLHDMLPGDSMVDHKGSIRCIGCGEGADCFDQILIRDDGHFLHTECRPGLVSRLATRFGGIDGDHHKQWLIDQMLRAALGPSEYEAWLKEMNSDPEYDAWDHGTPP